MSRSPFSRPALALLTAWIVGGAPMLAKTPATKVTVPRKTKTVALPQPVKITSVEGITEYRLANGLRVLLFPDPGKPTITVNVTYLVGSRHENYGETGMAHLLEHLVFRGTPKHPEIFKELTEHGTRPNGSTSEDRTNYFESFQATDENLAWALELEADRMINSNISKLDLWNPQTQKGEMTVVRNEFEMGENNPMGVLYERVLESAYLWHNYGKPTIGCKADIENVNEARLQAFYRTYYQPDNAVLLVAGKFDEAKTLKLVQDTFGPIPKPVRVLQPTYTVEPTQDGERQVIVRRVGDVQWAMAAYHTPAASDPDSPVMDVLTQVLADTPTGRLHKALVETKKATATFGWSASKREAGFVIYGVQVRQEDNLEEAKALFLKTLEDPTTLTFTAEAVERAKTQLLKQVELAFNDPDRVGLFMSEFIAMGDWRLFFLGRDRVKAVTTADVERVAKAYLKPSNRTLGLFIPTTAPDRTEVPALRDVEAMVKDYKGQAVVAQGEAFDARPEAIEPRIQYFTESNGLKGALLPKKTRGGSVAFQFRINLGTEQSLAGKALQGRFAANLLQRGTATHSRAELADLFDKAKAQVTIEGGPEQVMVNGETTKEHLSEVLRLVAEILKEPAFPVQEFEMMKQESLASIDQQRTEPSALTQKAYRRHLSPYPKGHVRYVSTLDEAAEAIKALRLEDVKAQYQAFYGASSADLALVGDLDVQETRALVSQLFGTWKSPTPWARVPQLIKEAPALDQAIEAPDKPNAFFLAGLDMPLNDTDPEFPAMAIANFMLGEGMLNSRLALRIRQKEGLSYSVGSQFDATILDRASSWIAYAIYAPQNLARLEAAFREELEKALKDGFTAQEIQTAKSGYLQGRQVSRSQDNELTGLLAGNLQYSRTLAYDIALEKQIQALTGEQILAALKKYLDPAKLVIVKAGDFAKAGKTEVKK